MADRLTLNPRRLLALPTTARHHGRFSTRRQEGSMRATTPPISVVPASAAIARAPYRRALYTSIASALQFAKPLFDASGFHGIRRVIDVSGDGTNNSGPLLVPVRDDVLASGATINGLPIMLKRPLPSSMDIDNLDIYYEDCVIGGPGAFVIPIRERAQFKEATHHKLVLEIAGSSPAQRVIPVQVR